MNSSMPSLQGPAGRSAVKKVKAEKILKGGFLLVVLYYFFEYLRVQDTLFSFLSPLKLPMLVTISLAIYLLKAKKLDKKKFKDPVLVAVCLLIIEMFMWVPFATNNFHAFQTSKSMGLTLVSMLATVVAVNSYERFAYFLKFLFLVVCLIAVWVLTHGGTGPGGFLQDENDAALVLITGLPLAGFCLANTEAKKTRFFIAAGFLLIISAVVATSSRGGFLGLVAVTSLILWYSRKRWRNIFLVIVFSLSAGGIVLSVLPEGYVDDMKTIENTNEGTANLRFLHWTTAMEIFKDNPIFGVGPDNYPWRSYEYFHLSPYFVEGARFRAGRQAHSLYFTLIPELGLVGISIFIFLIVKYFGRIRAFEKTFNNRADEELDKNERITKSAIKSLKISMAGFLVSGAFISVLYYPVFWHLLAISVALYHISLVGKKS